VIDLPNWVFFIAIAVIYIAGHLRGLPSEDQNQITAKWRLPIRIASTLLLIVALLLVVDNKDNLLVVILFAALGFGSGYLNGRAMDMAKIRALRGKQQTSEPDNTSEHEIDKTGNESTQK